MLQMSSSDSYSNPPTRGVVVPETQGGSDSPHLERMLAAIYEGAMETPPWTTALNLLKNDLKAEHVTLILRPPSSGSAGVMINTGVVTEIATTSYATQFYAVDPFVRLPEGEVTTAEELSGKTQWLQSAMYLGYLKPLGIRHLLGADIYTKEGIECRLRATRADSAPAFSATDKAWCRQLLPHLKRAIRLHARIDSLECERQLFAGAINRLYLGVMSFDHDGQILEINPEAQRILAEKDGISRVQGGIALSSNQENRELQKLIRQALAVSTATPMPGNGAPAMVEAMSVTRPSGRSKLGIVVRALPAGEFSESKHRPAAVLFLRDATAIGAQPSQDVVRRLFGLTRMEASLALLLAEGLTLDEAAEQLGVMRNTARTHLRSIFCKTGVTRQTMLVRLLLNSVVPLG